MYVSFYVMKNKNHPLIRWNNKNHNTSYNLLKAYQSQAPYKVLCIYYLSSTNILGITYYPWSIHEEMRVGEVWKTAKPITVIRRRARIQSLGTKAHVLPLGCIASPLGQLLHPEMICLLSGMEKKMTVKFLSLCVLSLELEYLSEIRIILFWKPGVGLRCSLCNKIIITATAIIFTDR